MLRKNIFYILASDLFIIFVGLYIFSFYSKYSDNDSFSLYSLSKRAIAFLQPLLFVNFGMGVTKIISGDISKKEKILNSSLLFLIINFLLIGLLILFGMQLSLFIFGSNKFYLLTLSVFFYIFTLNFHSLIVSLMRGYLEFIKLSLINFLNLGIIPLICIYISKEVENFYLLNSFLILLINSFIFSFIVYKNQVKIVFNLKSVIDMREILSFSLLRMPADYMLSLIFYLPVLSVTHMYGHTEGGYFGFAISLINLGITLFNPIGVIMLPYSSKLLSYSKQELINKIYKIVYVALVLSCSFVILYFIFKKFLFYFFSEHTVYNTIGYLDIMIFSFLGYNLYVCLRSIVDGCDNKPRNVYNILITLIFLVVFILMFMVFKVKFLAPLSLTISLNLLGLLTMFFLYKLINKWKES